MFKLSESRDYPGVYCGAEGLYLASAPLIECSEGSYQLRPENEIATLLGAAYGEGAKDIPSWACGKRPYVGEKGRDFAKRLMDEKYGPGNWRPRSREYRQIQKFGDRSFRDPRSVLVPDDDSI